MDSSSPPTPAPRSRCGAATSTPTRSSRRSTSSGSPRPASRTACSRPGATTRASCSTSRSTPAPRSWSPAPTSAPARRGSTPSGRCRTTASRSSSAPASATSSAATRARPGCWSPVVDQKIVEELWDFVEAHPAAPITVDLTEQQITADGFQAEFEIDPYTRWRLLEGLDDIGLTLRQVDAIDAFEKRSAVLQAQDPAGLASPAAAASEPGGEHPVVAARRAAAARPGVRSPSLSAPGRQRDPVTGRRHRQRGPRRRSAIGRR